MKSVVIIDVNQQRQPQIATIVPVLKQAKTIKVIGVNERLSAWREGLSAHAAAEFIAPKSRFKLATPARVSLEVAREIEQNSAEDTQFVIVGANRAYMELEEELLDRGFTAQVWPQICPDRVSAFLQCNVATCNLVRDFYRKEIQEKRTVGVGEFANRLVNHIPEIKSPVKRKELFGTAKFNNILKLSGLKVRKGRVVGEAL
jgi:hypothetical protein